MNLSSLFSMPGNTATLDFSSLNEQQLLALAISLEEDDARIYSQYAQALNADYPDTAALFRGMAAEENTHRH
ncbi:MAG: rubrerythrin, partial [Betaproteobacteria bacterium]|nr:rubrerythrin [Betaproteobacteria bacterium]